MHHLLNLTLLLGQPLNVPLQIVKTIVHGINRLGVGVYVHSFDVGSLGLNVRLLLVTTSRPSSLIAKPSCLDSREILGEIL